MVQVVVMLWEYSTTEDVVGKPSQPTQRYTSIHLLNSKHNF